MSTYPQACKARLDGLDEVLGSWLDYAGVATFAASSAAVSRRAGVDLTATLLVACMAAIGGGTMRDLLIQQRSLLRSVLRCGGRSDLVRRTRTAE